MKLFQKILYYINPFNRLGKRKYSIVFPLIITILTALTLEIYYSNILHNPMLARTPAILIFIGFITYFSFHDGLRGGITATIITVLYYFYITFSQYTNEENFVKDLQTSIAFAGVYLFLTVVVGGLKQKTDRLLEKESDEKDRLQTILQQMPIGVVVTDKKGKVTHANKQLENILETKIPIGSVIRKDEAMVPKTYKKNPLVYVLNTGKAVMKKDYVVEKQNGKKIYIQISASPIHGNGNRIIAAAATVTDITRQKELENRKDDFVNIASHELKTPLTSMKLYLNSLSSRVGTYKDLQVKKIIKNIHYQTDRLQELVDDLLDVSRLQTGKMTFTKEPFLLNNLLRETIESVKPIAKEQNIIFLEKASPMVSADKFRLHQVITNLLTNAIKYSNQYSEIIVQTKKTNEKVIVSVKDSGIGISKEEQKKIFNRLYQVSDKKGKTFPGLGIGLYISKQIMKRHKGALWVESEKGKGSTFYFSLPLLQNNMNYDKKTNKGIKKPENSKFKAK